MSLFPAEDILTKEIESWTSFATTLNSEEYREIFNQKLNCAMSLFPAEGLCLIN